MEINIQKQKEFLSDLGSTDGKLNATQVTIDLLFEEQGALLDHRKELLLNCQHIDEDGIPALSGGSMFVWCQICGKLLSDEEVKELENQTKE